MSPSEYQIFLRMNKAKELIRNTKMSVSDIAFAVGIENLGYFTRQFKQQEGLTPQAYRKIWPVPVQSSEGIVFPEKENINIE